MGSVVPVTANFLGTKLKDFVYNDNDFVQSGLAIFFRTQCFDPFGSETMIIQAN